MNAADVIGYALDGEIYCVEHTPESTCKCSRDANGYCEENCGGYGPNPIFADDAEPGMTCGEPGCGYLVDRAPGSGPGRCAAR